MAPRIRSPLRPAEPREGTAGLSHRGRGAMGTSPEPVDVESDRDGPTSVLEEPGEVEAAASVGGGARASRGGRKAHRTAMRLIYGRGR